MVMTGNTNYGKLRVVFLDLGDHLSNTELY